MAKGLYVGNDNDLSRKGKKAYFSPEGTSKKVKKIYLGDDNDLSQLIFASGELSYYGTATELSYSHWDGAATTVGDYALFGGGRDNENGNVVEGYTKSLTKITAPALSNTIILLAATTVGDYALFGGGTDSLYSDGASKSVDAYDISLTKTKAPAFDMQRCYLAATTVGDYALFGPGYGSDGNVYNNVDAYSASLTRSYKYSDYLNEYAATTVGSYALFGGGVDSDDVRSNCVYSFDTALSRKFLPTSSRLSIARNQLAATTVGDYALFAGGEAYSEEDTVEYACNTVDAYNSSLTRLIPTTLSIRRYQLAATTVGEYALFGGGLNYGYLDTVDVYDKPLTRSVADSFSLSTARYGLKATTVGDYALFGGGSGSTRKTVDTFQI